MDIPKKQNAALQGRAHEINFPADFYAEPTKFGQNSQVLFFPHRTQFAFSEHRRAIEKFDREGGIENYLSVQDAGKKYLTAYRQELRR